MRCKKIVKEFIKNNDKDFSYARLKLNKGECLAVYYDLNSDNIDLEVVQSYSKFLEQVFPDNKIIFVPNEFQLQVIYSD